MLRFSGLLLCAAAAASAHAAPAEMPAEAAAERVDAGTGFHLEPKSAIDDVFGDSSDYRRTVDRFLELTSSMQAMRDDFAHTVQSTLLALQQTRADGKSKRICPIDQVAQPYAHAHHLGAEYLRVGRELTRHYEQVKEFDRLGESVGLTPDYRWKVKRVLAQFNTLLIDYREMKVAFHDQLDDELKYAGCDLQALLLKGDPQGKTTLADWPAPGQPGAPGVQPVATRVAGEKAEHPDLPPPSLPQEKVPPPSPIALPGGKTLPSVRTDTQRSGILFYVDNTKCQRPTLVQLDGKKLGEVSPGQRVGFQTFPGPHDLCITDDKKPCGQPGTMRHNYLHEGWTISLRCE